ncbi:MAG: hypothetical protein AB1434_07400 [Pseudomonadota bacterium]
MEHLDPLVETSSCGDEGTFHHLIALFCTVAGNAQAASALATKFFNEIKDLGREFERQAGESHSE